MSGLTLKDLKCVNFKGRIWIENAAKESVFGFENLIGSLVRDKRVLKFRNITENILLKFYYFDEKNQRQYITFNKNCQMIYDDARFNDDGTPVEVDESVNENPVFIEENKISDEDFSKLISDEISDEDFSKLISVGGKKRRSSHKKRRSSHKKRRSSHKKRRSRRH